MKTITMALAAFILSFSAKSTDTSGKQLNAPTSPAVHQTSVLNNKTIRSEISHTTVKASSVLLAAEEKKSAMQYAKTMKQTLNLIDMEKHQQAIENLKASNAYNEMMWNLLLLIENEKTASALLEAEAAASFEAVMSNTMKQLTSF